MLSLHSDTSAHWIHQVETHLHELLIDHAHCEKKAAGVAMSLMFTYGDNVPLARAMCEIVNEELEHFQMVLNVLEKRSIPFGRQKPSRYGDRLSQLIGKNEPQRLIDKLLIASLIEARSCERFSILRDKLADKELADFFGGLFESEARHHTTYVKLAKLFQDADTVHARLHELSAQEALIIAEGDPYPRMHS